MMTLKPSDIFFSYPSIIFLVFLLISAASFAIWKWRDRFSNLILFAIGASTIGFSSLLIFYVAPAAKEVDYLYQELQKTNAISHVMGRVLPGTNVNQELSLLSQNQIPNSKFDMIPNNHMKILIREFGTSEQPIKMANPSQLETYLQIVNRCFSGKQRLYLFDQVKTLPVHATELQRNLDSAYTEYLNRNDRKPNPDNFCHSKLISGNSIPVQ